MTETDAVECNALIAGGCGACEKCDPAWWVGLKCHACGSHLEAGKAGGFRGLPFAFCSADCATDYVLSK